METSKKYGLLGSGISYSLSPVIHGFGFKELDINASYELIDIGEEDLTRDFVDYLGRTFSGFNVTIPFKEKIIPFLDIVNDRALRIGAVNTVLIEKNRMIGYNTDYSGFVHSVGTLGVEKLQSAIVLGTGGAAKMAVQALIDLGAKEVRVISRKSARVKGALTMDYKQLETEMISSDLLVNATPLGSMAHLDQMGISKNVLSRQKHVLDMVYKPEKTKLMREAEMLGIPCVNGLDMLVVQALEAEKIWLSNDLTLDMESLGSKIKLQIK